MAAALLGKRSLGVSGRGLEPAGGCARSNDPLKSVADQIAGRTICAFGEACAWPTQSFIAKFGDEFKGYAETKKAAKPGDAPELV